MRPATGHIMAAADSTGFAPLVQAGKVRVLNTWGAKRLETFPDAPTLKELGIDVVQNSPFGIGAPRDTPFTARFAATQGALSAMVMALHCPSPVPCSSADGVVRSRS